MDGNNKSQQQPPQPASGSIPQSAPQQPFGAPANPTVPTGPAPVNTPYQMPPKKGLSKGALWGIIGGIIGLVVLIVGIVLAVMLLGGPSKEDYANGLEDAQQVVKKYNAVGNKMNVSPQAARTAFDEYKDSVGKLADMKALNDKDVKMAYDNFNEKHEKISKLFPLMFDAAESCNSMKNPSMSAGTQSIVDSFKRSIEPCRKAAQKIIDEDIDEESTKMMKSLLAVFDEVIDVMTEIEQAKAAGDIARYNRAISRFRSLRRPNFTQSSEALNKLSAKEELNKLNDVLRAKANN